MAVTALVMLPSFGVAAAGLTLNAVVGGTKLVLSVARERQELTKLRLTDRFLFFPEAARRLPRRGVKATPPSILSR